MGEGADRIAETRQQVELNVMHAAQCRLVKRGHIQFQAHPPGDLVGDAQMEGEIRHDPPRVGLGERRKISCRLPWRVTWEIFPGWLAAPGLAAGWLTVGLGAAQL